MPWLTVHRKLFVPKPKPITVLVGLVGKLTVPVPPFKTVHKPLPTLGVTPCKLPVPVQLVLVKPASAATLLFTIFTLELLEQMPLTTVQTNALLPDTKPVAVVLACAALLMPAVPTLLQLPVPIDGTRALNTALFVQTLWSLPALEVDGVLFVTLTVPTALQVPLVTNHWKVFLPWPKPLTTTLLLLLFEKVPLPVVTLQVPGSLIVADKFALVPHTC